MIKKINFRSCLFENWRVKIFTLNQNLKSYISFCLTEFCSNDFFFSEFKPLPFQIQSLGNHFSKYWLLCSCFQRGNFFGRNLWFFQGASLKKFSLQLWGPWKQKRIHSSRDYWEKNDAFKIKTWDKLQRKTVLTEEIWGLGSNFLSSSEGQN